MVSRGEQPGPRRGRPPPRPHRAGAHVCPERWAGGRKAQASVTRSCRRAAS